MDLGDVQSILWIAAALFGIIGWFIRTEMRINTMSDEYSNFRSRIYGKMEILDADFKSLDKTITGLIPTLEYHEKFFTSMLEEIRDQFSDLKNAVREIDSKLDSKVDK